MFHTTFTDFLNQHFNQHNLSGSLKETLFAIINACVAISAKTRLGALSGVLGEAGSGNIQGENQKKLDVIANQILIDALKATREVAGIASEEEDTFVETNENGEYLVLFDPLDGSSNIDVNISVGTIFSVLKKPSSGSLKTDDFLQNGRNQVAAGYVLYGVQTQLVFTAKHGVFGFTLNEQNQFILTKNHFVLPETTAEFAINMSNQRHWKALCKTILPNYSQAKTVLGAKITICDGLPVWLPKYTAYSHAAACLCTHSTNGIQANQANCV